MIRIVRVTDTDVPIGIDHVFIGKNTVGDHQVAQKGFEIGHHPPSNFGKRSIALPIGVGKIREM